MPSLSTEQSGFFVPTDVDQTVFQQPYVQFLSQELVFYPHAEIFPSAV